MEMSRPVPTAITQQTSIGMVKECQIGTWLRRVVPVSSMATAAICGPLAGKSQMPTIESHRAVTVAGARLATKAIGIIIRVVVDWLVVSAATRKMATPRKQRVGHHEVAQGLHDGA